MTTNPTPVRGEVWRIRFDPAEGDEIKKVRTMAGRAENLDSREDNSLQVCYNPRW